MERRRATSQNFEMNSISRSICNLAWQSEKLVFYKLFVPDMRTRQTIKVTPE
jgi:hypothetical protein